MTNATWKARNVKQSEVCEGEERQMETEDRERYIRYYTMIVLYVGGLSQFLQFPHSLPSSPFLLPVLHVLIASNQ